MVASPPTRTLDLGRDVAGAAGRGPAGARPPRLGALFPGQVLEQGRESAVEDLRRVAAGDRVAQEVLRASARRSASERRDRIEVVMHRIIKDGQDRLRTVWNGTRDKMRHW